MDQPMYQSVDSRYTTQLRLEAVFNWGITALIAAALIWLVPGEWRWLPAVGLILVLITLLALILFWAPRRYKLTGYQVSPLDVHYRTGALWRLQTSVPVNRIQHVEISQGPLERGLGLARLVLYTAGGAGSDLAVPGLRKEHAETLRSQLLGLINDEQDN